MDFPIIAMIAGALLIGSGLWIINRATSPDAASGGFGLVFFGAVMLAFALLVVFVSRVHGLG